MEFSKPLPDQLTIREAEPLGNHLRFRNHTVGWGACSPAPSSPPPSCSWL
jgi:hypothetical protein